VKVLRRTGGVVGVITHQIIPCKRRCS
jgi:hypothetical protein